MIPSADVNRIERAGSFHRSLRAAMAAGASLNLGTVGSEASTRGLGGVATPQKIDRLEELLIASLEANRFAEISQSLPGDYVAAWEYFEQSGAVDRALDSLSLPRTIEVELSDVVRPSWFYLTLLLCVATAGIAVFSTFSVPRLVAIRADMELMPRASVSHFWIAEWDLRWLLVLLPLLAVATLGLALSNTASAWVVNALGGRRYRDDRTGAMKTLIECAKKNSKVGLEAHAEDARLSLLTKSRNYRAHWRLMRLRVALPTLLTVLIGGGGVFVYGLILYGPLVVLIHDMATLAADRGVWP